MLMENKTGLPNDPWVDTIQPDELFCSTSRPVNNTRLRAGEGLGVWVGDHHQLDVPSPRARGVGG